MYFHFKHNATGWIYWNYTGITLKSHWMGYTETTLELHWNATGWIHWKYTETSLHLQRTLNAPPAHPKCTSSVPQMCLQCTSNTPQLHLQRTPNAPPAHLKQCISSAPQIAHLLAPQPHLHICTRTSSTPQLHLPAPQLHLPAPQPLQIHV